MAAELQPILKKRQPELLARLSDHSHVMPRAVVEAKGDGFVRLEDLPRFGLEKGPGRRKVRPNVSLGMGGKNAGHIRHRQEIAQALHRLECERHGRKHGPDA